MLQFKRLLALGGILIVFTVGTTDNAYGHSCGHSQSCYFWPMGVISSFEDAITTVLIVGILLAIAMIVFKFDYLKRRDFYVVRHHPTSDRINRLLFEGRDKRKMFAAIPFLAFGGLLFVASIQMLFAYGFTEYESCESYRMPICQTTTYANTAFIVILYSMPFIGGGAFLLVTGVRAISLVTMKKEQLCY